VFPETRLAALAVSWKLRCCEGVRRRSKLLRLGPYF
jgi:hypothetical protein